MDKPGGDMGEEGDAFEIESTSFDSSQDSHR